MARSKRKQKPRKPKDDDDKEEVYDEPDPEKDEYFQDEVDKFHAEREKILLDSTADHDQQGESDHNDDMYQDDEMMLLDVEESDIDDDSNDDAEEEGDEDNKEEGDKDEASEEDESESENEKDQSKGIPSQKSWGRKKDAFYDADIVEEYAGSDEEMDKLAEEEEEEALALQKQMAAALEEQDFDTAVFELPQTVQDKDKDDSHKEKIIQDLSKLSKAEKIEILIKDSPELFHLLDEFKLKLKEVIEKLHPLVNMARAGRVPQQGANYLELKHQLYLNYCINIGFYLLLKAKQTPARNHPVIGRLVQYGKLIKELEPLDKKVELELEILLSQRQSDKKNGLQDNIDKESTETTIASRSTRKQPTKLSTLLDGNSDSEENDRSESNKESKKHKTSSTEQMLQSIENKKKGKKSKRKLEEPSESMDPLAYYEAVKLQKKKKKEGKKAVVGFSDELDLDQDDPGKRGITYEISKNKGLTAKKKKELQNPRVKHRRKFFKAQIKRKSQVRPVVNEQNRYGGEMTGIRSHLTRSTKIK